MPLLKKVRAVAAKIESTAGTAETLANTDAGFRAYEQIVQPDIEASPRMKEGFFSPLPAQLGAYGGTCKFSVDLIGGVTDPKFASVLLPACGWVESTGTYSPSSEAPGSNVKTLTIGLYQNGRRKQLRGCVGTWSLVLPAGKVPRIDFEFTGLWSSPTDTAMLSGITDPTLAPIRFASSTYTIGGFAPKANETVIAANNEITLRQDPTDSTGYAHAIITGREVTLTHDGEAELVATDDLHGDWLARTEKVLSIIIGSASNRVTLGAPAMLLRNPQEGDRNGLETDQTEWVCDASSGDDEFTWAFD